VLLSGENADAPAALRHNYWPLVRVLLAGYRPAAVERVSAVRLHTGEENLLSDLQVVQSSVTTRRTVEIAPGLRVEVRASAHPTGPGQTVEVIAGGVPIPVLSPARTLLSLTLRDVRDNRDLVLAWLLSLRLARPDLESAYRSAPRHVLLARFGHLAEEIGNPRLAEQIRDLLASEHRNPVGRAHTGVGAEIMVPSYIVAQPSVREPWSDRLRARLAKVLEVVSPIAEGAESKLGRLSATEVLARARVEKLEDTYHSTTIEGYRITRDDVRAVVEGIPFQGKTPQEIERLMALEGYSRAFERTLEMIGASGRPGGAGITESDCHDLYVELWGPSVDAGIVSAAALRGWRTDPVYIKNSSYVPPAPEKVSALMRVLTEEVSRMDAGPLTRAIALHWGFVHVHPYKDGNGRISRLLMNLVIGAGGLPWTTIRADQKTTYFAALEHAHIAEDYAPFAEFIIDCVMRAASNG
jgi:Fic family protein